MATRARPPSPTFASLFCGCGGFDLGFAQAGFRCMGAFDVDPVAVKVHQRNLGAHAQVHDLSAKGLLPVPMPDLDVLVAGPPCQGFSTMGRRDPKDPRNSLMLRAGDIAVAIQPKVVVVENVVGVMAGAQRRFWQALRRKLENAGYQTIDFLVDVRALGIAQRRRRMILVAWNTGHRLSVPMPTGQAATLKDALKGVTGKENHKPRFLAPSSLGGRIAPRIKRGQKLCNVRAGSKCVPSWAVSEVFGKVTRQEIQVLELMRQLRRRDRRRAFGDADPVSARSLSVAAGKPIGDILKSLIAKGYVRRVDKLYDLTHTFNGKYRRLEWSESAPTVDTRFGDPRYFLHPDANRGFTVREAARIQGFPDSFVFEGELRSQYRLVGNAVPPPLGHFLGKMIREKLLEAD